MIKDGLYSAQFSSPLGSGSGVVVVSGGSFRGGDAIIAYVGTLADQGGNVSATLKTFRHTQAPGTSSVFGRDEVDVHLAGSVQADSSVTLAAAALNFKAVLRWLHE